MAIEGSENLEDPTLEIGRTGLRQYGGHIDEEFRKQLRGRRGKQFYREMADNDPTVGGMLFIVESFLRQVEHRVEPANESEGAEAARGFIEGALKDMTHTWEEFFIEVLSMLPFGFAVFEVVYKVRRGEEPETGAGSLFDDGRVGWKKFAIRSQETIDRWSFDEDGLLQGVYQDLWGTDGGMGEVFIPVEKMLLFRTKTHKDNPEGRSMLRNAARPYYFKKRIEEFEAIGTERDLAGYPVLTVPVEIMSASATASQKAARRQFEKLVTEVRRDQREGIVMPAELDKDGNPTGYSFKLMASGGSRQLDTDKIIRRYRFDIANSLLAEFILMGGENVGSFSMHSSKTSVFSMALKGILDTIVSVFNRCAIVPLCKLNGIETENIPRLVSGDIETPPLEEVGAFLQALTSAGIPLDDMPTQRALRMIGNLPEPPEPDLDLMALEGLMEEEGEQTELDARLAAIESAIGLDPSTGEATGSGEEAAVTLNGAQINAVIEVLGNVANGTISRVTAFELLDSSFPIPEARINRMLDNIKIVDVREQENAGS